MGRGRGRERSDSEEESGSDDDRRKKDKRSRSPKRKEKDRSRSKRRRRERSESSSSEDDKPGHKKNISQDMTEEQLMMTMMGFGSFDTSKAKDHSNTDLSDVKRATKRQYRQYMNRRGGFNRPLDAAF